MPAFREVSLDFLHALQDAMPPEALYRHGRGWGREQAAGIRAEDDHLKIGEALSRWSVRLAAEGWGTCRFDLRGSRRGEVRADVENSPLAQRAAALGTGKGACALLAGQFAGAFEELSQRPSHALEIGCRSSGEAQCRFLIGPAHWINAELFWTHEGMIWESEPPLDSEPKDAAVRLSQAFWAGFALAPSEPSAIREETERGLLRCGRRWGRSLSRRLERDFLDSYGTAAPAAPARVFEEFLIAFLRRWGWGEFAMDEARRELDAIPILALAEMPAATRWVLSGAFAGVFSQLAQEDWDCVCERAEPPDAGCRFWIAAADRAAAIRDRMAPVAHGDS